ncbi:MAG TPA: hypothetical protein PKA13_12900 [Geminicoccaceae bacterium]|nr:hypothetical protein [Geminicoccus sp.]HMU50665.1 hypothetical protein [Geminicoccaceae bacterium]
MALVLGISSWSASAWAEALSTGSLLAIDSAPTEGDLDGTPLAGRFESRRDLAAMSFDFTPRNPLSLLFDEPSSEVGEPAELRLAVERDPVVASRFASLGSHERAPAAGLSDSALEIGGALHFADWVVGSGYARAPLFGGEADMVSATLGYGRVQARLAYGQTERKQADSMDVLTFSTDLAAWSWLTLESDLAVGAAADRTDESLAAGRLGIRLNF